MIRTPFAAFVLALVVGCNTGSRDKPTPAVSPGASGPGSVNVLTGAGGSTASSTSSTNPGATAAGGGVAPSGSASVAPAASASPGAGTPAAPPATTPVAATGAQAFGTIPTDPTTGFDGTLYLVGERFVPGSVVSVEVNGVWTKVLPATFYSSELLGFYVYLTVPADYAFTVVAPDGSRSTPARVTVPNAGTQTLLGLNPPVVHMVYPPSLDTNFSGTLWLIGDQFMPGSVALVGVAGWPAVPMPLTFLNERTVGLTLATPLSGDITIQVSNPTFMTSQTFTITVGAATAPLGAQAPTFSAPASIVSPFVGSVHLMGTDLLPGAVAELRTPGGPTLSTTPLIRISSQEAWWTLAYPAPGAYEVRVVNPGGAAAPWTAFTVN